VANFVGVFAISILVADPGYLIDDPDSISVKGKHWMISNRLLRADKAWTTAIGIGALTLLLQASVGTAVTNCTSANTLSAQNTATKETPTVHASKSSRPGDYSQAIGEARKIARGVYQRGAPGLYGDMKGHTARPAGLSVAIAIDGQIVWSEGFGLADLEQQVPVTPATKFRIGSVSKVLAIAAVAQLYEQGRLDIDAPIQKYVPSFPDKGYVITTRQLAGHLGGIRHYRDDEPTNQKRFNSLVEGFSLFENDPLVAPPGTKFFYSSYGYNLIGAVVEGASGEDYRTYLRTHVFVPLGMDNTEADDYEKIILHRARFYDPTPDGNFKNSEYEDVSYKWPSGGMLSTPEDLVRFGLAHLHPGFLKSSTLQLLFTPTRTTSGENTGHGMGWRIRTDHRWGPELDYEHGGEATGGTCSLILYPETGVVIAAAINAGNMDFAGIPAIIAVPFLRQLEEADRK
jgi:CubicO group peptidase (beta-lactamase class C family)